MKLFRHKKAVLLSVLTIIISFSITTISSLTIYNKSQNQVYERLQEIVNHKKAEIELLTNRLGVNEYDINGYLEQVRNKNNSFGENGEIILAHMVNDSIQFVISEKLSSKYPKISKSIPFATPMQKALNRENGFMKGADYNGIEVFSAFTFVEKLNCASGEAINISRNDLASVAGVATESLIRTLSSFKNQRIIEIEGRNIKILDLQRLREIQ